MLVPILVPILLVACALRFAPVRSSGLRMLCRERAVELKDAGRTRGQDVIVRCGQNGYGRQLEKCSCCEGRLVECPRSCVQPPRSGLTLSTPRINQGGAVRNEGHDKESSGWDVGTGLIFIATSRAAVLEVGHAVLRPPEGTVR